jgi:hypothetical protein
VVHLGDQHCHALALRAVRDLHRWTGAQGFGLGAAITQPGAPPGSAL